MLTPNSPKIPKIRVLVRKRPLNKKQQLKLQTDIITIQHNQSVLVRQQKLKVDLTPYIDEYRFNFDGAFDQYATNQQIYGSAIRPLVDCAFDGARVSCFAYGQTGSGKTYTMLGDGGEVKGLYLLAAYDIFQQLSKYEKLTVWISFYEIYCGKLYDLLNDRNVLFARQDAKSNVNIVGLSQRKLVNVDNLMQIIQFGTSVRVTAQNGTNVDSSRSHAILQISLKVGNKIHGKISFIDLAGSQRAADHADQLQKQTRIDGAQINKSLLALKQCIRALDQNKNHTPFRGSKLTMVLKDSFTGYCRTVMIGNISPNSSSSQNTLNTLKYADRVKQLKRPSKDHQLMQLDNLDLLSKQLMLPRQLVNHKKYVRQGQQLRQSQMPLNPVNHQRQNTNQNSPYKNEYQYKAHSKQIEQQPPLFTKSHRVSQPPHTNLYPQPQPYPYPHYRQSPTPKQPPQPHPYPHNRQKHPPSHLFPKPALIQQQQPPISTTPQLQHQHLQHLEHLTKHHQSLIQQVLTQQQHLMSCHQQHINTTIELIKQQMFLMNEADKVGSDIGKYLDDLDGVLERELASIMAVRERVHRLKRDLRESRRVEREYVEASRRVFGGLGVGDGEGDGDEQMMVEDDQHLFY